MVQIDVSQLNALAADLGKVGARATAKAALAVRKVCADTQADAAAFCPVDTGYLRQSITSTVRGLTGVVGPTASYGVFVEFGTSRTGPQAFMGPAFDRNVPHFVKACEQIAETASS